MINSYKNQDIRDKHLSRREFLQFLGYGSAYLAFSSSFGFLACDSTKKTSKESLISSLSPSIADDLLLVDGLKYDVVIKRGDLFHDDSSLGLFGDCNDFIAMLPLQGRSDDCVMMVNHEYFVPLFINGFDENASDVDPLKKSRSQVDIERANVGVSLFRIKKTKQGWKIVKNDPLNRRIDGVTPIDIVGERSLFGQTKAVGTFSNCGGGVTPWKTFLTCEENYDYGYGEISFQNRGSRKREFPAFPSYGWQKYYSENPENYGWVVEINPWTGYARKLLSLGRFFHEAATVVEAKDGRPVVYMGDDKKFECIYKFIGDEHQDLTRGTLYVANVEKGKWIPLDIKQHKVLQENFKDQTEVLTYCQYASKLVGGTPMDRPEDIAVNPGNYDIIVSLTNNDKRGNPHGSLFRIREKDADYAALEFSSDTFLMGGKQKGFSCPDNLEFDKKGNLWFCSDISSSKIEKKDYKGFGNNAVFYVPVHGYDAGKVFQIASGPKDCEMTGLCFAPDGKTLFVSVQHPGDLSRPGQYTSHWPEKGQHTPKSAVVQITGPTLDKLLGS